MGHLLTHVNVRKSDAYNNVRENDPSTNAPEGLKYIKDIQIGDTVKVFNEDTREIGTSTVTSISSHEVESFYKIISFSNHYSLWVTGEHPVYVLDKDDGLWKKEGTWTLAKDLKFGDKLATAHGFHDMVTEVIEINEPRTVYNMEVDGEHNYFANGLLVHNKGGAYIGKDKYKSSNVGESRSEINSQAGTFNQNVPNAVGNSLASQFEAARTFQNAVGLSETSIDGATEGNTGFQKQLADSLADNAKGLLNTQQDLRSTKTSSLKSAGEVFRDTQKQVNAASESSGMVSGGERMQMDADVNLASSGGEAQTAAKEGSVKAVEEKGYEDQKAKDDFRDAVKQAKIDMEQGMKDQINSVVNVLEDETSALNETWKGTGGDLRKAQKKNMQARVNKGGNKSKKGANPTPITQSSYTGTITSDPGEKSGTAFAVTSSIDLAASGGVKDAGDKLEGMGMGNFAEVPAIVASADNNLAADIDPGASIQSVWSGATGAAKLQSVIGPGNKDAVSGDNQWIAPKCFAGKTLIDIEVL